MKKPLAKLKKRWKNNFSINIEKKDKNEKENCCINDNFTNVRASA